MTGEKKIPDTAFIGILGSGQLGRMIAIAAAQLGLDTHIYAPDAAASPAAAVAGRWTEAAYDDLAALDAFAASVDVVTSEFENIPADVMARLATHGPAAICGSWTCSWLGDELRMRLRLPGVSTGGRGRRACEGRICLKKRGRATTGTQDCSCCGCCQHRHSCCGWHYR